LGDVHVQHTQAGMALNGSAVGMAPLRAVIHAQTGKSTEPRVSCFYGARTVADLFYTAECDALAARHPIFTWPRHCPTRPRAALGGLGRPLTR